MLHKKRVFIMAYYAARKRLRLLLRVPPRPQPPPVLRQDIEKVVERHSGIARALLSNLPSGLSLAGKSVCEVGSGDCLAAASVMLGLGARHVDMVEISAPVVNEKQREVLQRLQSAGLPVDLSFIQQVPNGFRLDPERIAYHQCYMENLKVEQQQDFMFSFSVMEHVEDLDGFYRSSSRVMNSGAWMLHIIDLGGHEQFEDPLPPLDFQTYPNWLYWLMCPKYHRATRFLIDEHKAAATRGGFNIEKIHAIRRADPQYLEQVWPRLRREARALPKEEMGVVEFALLARKN